jgi:predicted transcriptional regulator
VGRFFKNSHEQLVLNLLEDEGIEPEEIGRLREMLTQKSTSQRSIVPANTTGSDAK